MKKVVFSIILLLIIFAVGFSLPIVLPKSSTTQKSVGGYTISRPTPPPVFILSVSKPAIKKGETVIVTGSLPKLISTVVAAEVYFGFDPNVVQVVKVQEGDAFPVYPIKLTGKDYVKVSGVSKVQDQKVYLPQNQTFAKLTFKALKGDVETKIYIDDALSSLIEDGKNILTKGSSVTVKIE